MVIKSSDVCGEGRGHGMRQMINVFLNIFQGNLKTAYKSIIIVLTKVKIERDHDEQEFNLDLCKDVIESMLKSHLENFKTERRISDNEKKLLDENEQIFKDRSKLDPNQFSMSIDDFEQLYYDYNGMKEFFHGLLKNVFVADPLDRPIIAQEENLPQ